jgi:hypothetical protein
MKLITLKRYFYNTSKTKLFMIGGAFPDEFLMTGICYNPREDGDDLLVDAGPYVVYSFQRDRPLRSAKPFAGLRLVPGSKMTRRLQTHRRNVAAHRNLGTLARIEEYFELAWSLGHAEPSRPRQPVR